MIVPRQIVTTVKGDTYRSLLCGVLRNHNKTKISELSATCEPLLAVALVREFRPVAVQAA